LLIIRSAMKKEAISEHYLEQAARREAAAAMWMQHIATNVTSVAEELARITAAGHKLHGTDLPEPMELETGPPETPRPPAPAGRSGGRRALALAAPPFYCGRILLGSTRHGQQYVTERVASAKTFSYELKVGIELV
jgi:hypothetical protein